MYDFNIIDNNNYIYSIDMIRINFELNESVIDCNDKFDNFLYKLDIDPFCNIKRFINKNGVGYHYLYNIIIYDDDSINKISFVIGLGLNFIKDNEHKGFIEFNPNKCNKFNKFLQYFNLFKSLCYSFKVVRYDLAIDIKEKRKNIKMVNNCKCNYQLNNVVIDNGNGLILDRSITEYSGRRNHNKFTKLYDKTKESKLNYDLTRIEFTFNRDEIKFNNLPRFILIINTNLNLSNKDNVFLQLLLNSNDFNFYYKNLSYRQRKRLDKDFCHLFIEFDLHNFNIIREKVLSYEFNLNPQEKISR